MHTCLQYVAVYCSMLQYDAVYCSVLQCVAVCYSVLQCVTVRCSVLQCVAVCCSLIHTHDHDFKVLKLLICSEVLPSTSTVLRIYTPESHIAWVKYN